MYIPELIVTALVYQQQQIVIAATVRIYSITRYSTFVQGPASNKRGGESNLQYFFCLIWKSVFKVFLSLGARARFVVSDGAGHGACALDGHGVAAMYGTAMEFTIQLAKTNKKHTNVLMDYYKMTTLQCPRAFFFFVFRSIKYMRNGKIHTERNPGAQ